MTYREKSLREFAARKHYDFTLADEFGVLPLIRDFRLVAHGRASKVTNVVRARDDLMVKTAQVFDYSNKELHKSEEKHQTVLFLQSQQLVLPELLLQPETLLHKIGELFGFGDIDFVRYPKFSSQYRLTGGDEDYIRHHFTEEVLSYFTTNKGWTLEGLGYYILLYKKGVLLPPEEIQHLLWRGYRVAELLSTQVI